MKTSITRLTVPVTAMTAAFVAFGALGSLEPVQAATIGSASYTWTGDESTQTQRLFRDGVASTIASPKSFPGVTGNGAFGYQTFSFLNNGPATPFTVDVTSISPAFSTHFAAYLNSYDPTNQALNYLGDIGRSVPQAFSFLVPENQQFLVVAQTVDSLSNSIGNNFSFTVSTLAADDVSATPIPTPALLPGLIGLGVGILRQRKTKAMKAANEV